MEILTERQEQLKKVLFVAVCIIVFLIIYLLGFVYVRKTHHQLISPATSPFDITRSPVEKITLTYIVFDENSAMDSVFYYTFLPLIYVDEKMNGTKYLAPGETVGNFSLP